MADRGHAAAKDRKIHSNDLSQEWPVDARPDVEDDESRNSLSGAPENDTGTTGSAQFNPQILRRPSRQPADSNEDMADNPLPVPVQVEVCVAFERGEPIPNLPHPSLDASLKSEAFDDIRQLILDDAASPQQEAQVNEEAEDLFSSEDSDGEGQGLFAVDSLRYFLRNIHFDDSMMT